VNIVSNYSRKHAKKLLFEEISIIVLYILLEPLTRRMQQLDPFVIYKYKHWKPHLMARDPADSLVPIEPSSDK